MQMRKTGRRGHQMEQQMAVAVKTTRGWAEVSLCPSWCVKKRGTRRQVSYTSVLPDVPGQCNVRCVVCLLIRCGLLGLRNEERWVVGNGDEQARKSQTPRRGRVVRGHGLSARLTSPRRRHRHGRFPAGSTEQPHHQVGDRGCTVDARADGSDRMRDAGLDWTTALLDNKSLDQEIQTWQT